MLKNQETILNILQDSNSHLTADEIYMQCRLNEDKMSIATVYRNLGIMVDNGFVAKISVTGHPEYYDCNLSRHEHILCESCGKIKDVHINDLQGFLEKEAGIKLKSYSLCMKYICSECEEENVVLNNRE